MGKIKNKLKTIPLVVDIFNLMLKIYYFFKGDYRFFEQLERYIYNGWLTNFPCSKLRILYLRTILKVKIGRETFVHMGCRFEGDIVIGDNCVIGRSCILNGEIIIKNNVSITAEAYIFSTSHIVNDPDFKCFYKPVCIDDYAWIGARVIIQPGVSIGKGAVLGSGSVVTQDVVPYGIFAGVPAKSIGTRSSDLKYNLKYFPFFQ